MDSDDRSPAAGAVAQSAHIPISELSPEREDISTKSVHAVVTLVWPYSSSSQSLSLLLAEPDFRLRRSQGQVKVNFHGTSAQEVAQTHVGIGDEVHLSLKGVRWTDTQGPLATPGRNVSWDINFENHVTLEISRDSRPLASVQVDRPASPPQNDGFATPAKPPAMNLHTELEGPSVGSAQWASPAFLRSNRQSLGSVIGPAFDPFAEEDGYVPGKGRKRPRFSMRSNEWRLVDEPASPVKEETPWGEMEDMDMQDDELEAELAVEETASNLNGAGTHSPKHIDAKDVAAEPMVTEESLSETAAGLAASDKALAQDRSIQRPQDAVEVVRKDPQLEFTPPVVASQRTSRAPTDTPRLLPLLSPGLLVPSPLVTVSPSPQGYFPTVVESTTSSEPPVVSVGSGDHEATIQNGPLQEAPSQDLLQEATARVLEHAAADAVDASMEANKPSSSETIAGISTQVPHSPPVGESDVLIESSNFQVVEEGVLENTGEIAGVVEEAAEIDEARSLSESVETESGGFDEDDENIRETRHEDREAQLGDGEGVDEHEEYESTEHEEGYSNRSRNYSRSPPVPIEEESESESEISEEETEAEFEYVKREYVKPSNRESPEERLHDTASYVAEDEYDDAEEDEEQSEEQSEEEFDEEYESVHVYEDESEESLGSEADSEDAPSTRPQAPAPERTVHPEIIVLDSDSEEESGVAGNHSVVPPEDQRDVLVKATATRDQNELSVLRTVHAEGSEEIQDNEEGIRYSETEESQDSEHSETSAAPGSPATGEDVSDSFQEESEEEVHQEVQEETHQYFHREIQEEAREEAREENLSPSEESHGSVSYPFFTPETDLQQPISDEHSESAIDPELLRSQQIPPTSAINDNNKDAHEQKDEALLYDRSSNLSRSRDQGLFLDGPNSPQHSGQVERGQHQYIELHGQLPTPNATQQMDPVSPEPDDHIARPEFMPTPRNTQDPFTEQLQEDQPTLPDTASPAHIEIVSTDFNGQKEENIPGGIVQHVSRHVSSRKYTATVPVEDKPLAADDTGLDREEQPEVQQSIESNTDVVDRRPVQVSVEISPAASPPNPPALPDRKARGFRSAHSYFAPLATLFDLFNSVIDTISVVVETSAVSRSASGPRDYFLTLQLTDPSMAGTILPAQIFRPYKTVLPAVKEGDVILLRNFKVRTFNHSMMLLSTDTSAWAVFDGEMDEARVAGPPVEYGLAERSYADSLREWFREDGAAMVADYRLQLSIDRASRGDTPSSSAAISDTGSIDSGLRESRGDSLFSHRGSRRNRKGNRRITIHELRDGTRYTEVGSPSDKESIHELRDGTVYANL
ncbi:hypothetical protein C8Q69DRAFT_516471 [Paecilomyces variotii]|uniref:Telomeric single stranded DNA binding POT1/Cdc13 domain-containing protein n=1 Tax=Byssochlamys spectabilis TaxID=264951 RepID=A0A443I0M3_BYSSP|nr:hypothetical protein C8Q69DRAFT_516471 [Paecilomyces variotii]KAJ9365134.1 hypothetical protein DTO280E4_789 [Paecilomyces variotii]KAJ9368804.1 hypothetical protein DTO282E5_6539 [Paecilomyces variotii]KAJ9385937.1 hypothetical protein DTO063F5_3901 [Paecilomyces variotii]RWQ97608.1 hypothetical protein C8Q69DRAFT_516471 [Paecilomyces variotii]